MKEFVECYLLSVELLCELWVFFSHQYAKTTGYEKIARVTRADRIIMVEVMEGTGVQRSLTERLVRSRLQWAGHVERMADDRLPKRAAELREQGTRRRGRSMLTVLREM